MDALCIGHAAWDLSLFLHGFPAEDGKCEVRTMIECGGGPAANAACLLSRWGVACALAASIGDDAYGQRVTREHSEAGTDITLLRRSAGQPTPVSVILVNEHNGSRTIINRKPSAVGEPLRLVPCPAWSPPPRVLLFDGHEPDAALEAMELFPRARTILDAGSLRPGTQQLVRRVDFLVCSEKFACEFSGVPDLRSAEHQTTAVGTLHRGNGRPVVITCGGRGILHGTPEHIEQLPALPVHVCDTTGAGDIFHGAFAFGILQERSWAETLRLAIAAASLSVTMRGGRTSIPSLRQVEEVLRDAG